MPRYHHKTSYHQQTRFIKRTRRFVTVIIALVLLAGMLLFVDSRRETHQAATPSDPTTGVTGSFMPAGKIFISEYFQFQAHPNWKQIQNESTATRFVYRSFRGTLVEHELIISINDAASSTDTTRILPVELGPNYQFMAGKASAHCKTALPGGAKDKAPVTLSEVRFMCVPDSASYIISVGLKGSGAPMKITRPNGSIANYSITYRDVTAHPDEKELQEIIKVFQIR